MRVHAHQQTFTEDHSRLLCVLSPRSCSQGCPPPLADAETEAPESAQKHTAHQRSSGRPIQVCPAPGQSVTEGSWIMSAPHPPGKCPVLLWVLLRSDRSSLRPSSAASPRRDPGTLQSQQPGTQGFPEEKLRSDPQHVWPRMWHRAGGGTPSRRHLAMGRPQKGPSVWAGRGTQDLR